MEADGGGGVGLGVRNGEAPGLVAGAKIGGCEWGLIEFLDGAR